MDRLLASPHYGERWARRWLDAARYADTNGYEKDRERSIWPYRDWVIKALNDDMPFDQFTVEQIAGDLLPGATVSQKVATGFHRNTMINEEGGIDVEEFRFASLVDRVATTGSGLARPDHPVRPVPHPQIRPDHPARVLPVLRLLQQRRRARSQPARPRHRRPSDRDPAQDRRPRSRPGRSFPRSRDRRRPEVGDPDPAPRLRPIRARRWRSGPTNRSSPTAPARRPTDTRSSSRPIYRASPRSGSKR